MKQDELTRANEKIAMRVSTVSVVGNVLLTVFKLLAGVIAHSGAMVSDAVHSLSDVLSTLVVMVGIKMSGKPSDKNHPYGHERIESVAAIILSIMLLAAGAGIGYNGLRIILSGQAADLQPPGMLALVAAVVSIVVKEAMYWYTRTAAIRINSVALRADAWHHRSDALSSLGSFAGILGARLGLPILDPLASVLICVLISKVAIDIFMDGIRKMTDEACDEQTVGRIENLVKKQAGVLRIDQLKTRLFGSRIYVDLEISADSGKTLKETHGIAEMVHDTIEREIPEVKHCMVHINPL